ncbi:unnamed protein product [Coffea canephora]|uniref:Uncharacterized protein n=1 Tax=Coffea canephora TaxID=49390 RepID=A0A068UUL4_COFCA|nr:unnamed protein product [Coffea canephora]
MSKPLFTQNFSYCQSLTQNALTKHLQRLSQTLVIQRQEIKDFKPNPKRKNKKQNNIYSQKLNVGNNSHHLSYTICHWAASAKTIDTMSQENAPAEFPSTFI